MKPGFAKFLIVVGWFAVIFVICLVAVAVAHGYPAWSLLIYFAEYTAVFAFGWQIPYAWRAVVKLDKE